MTDDFSARARQVEEMLRADTTAFVLVSTAQTEPIDEAIWFRRTLQESGLPFAGVVVNRVHHDLLGASEPDDVRRPCADKLGAELAGTGGAELRRLPRAGAPRRAEHRPAERRARRRRRRCSSPTSTTTSTTSRACCGCTASCSRSAAERERLIAEVVA